MNVILLASAVVLLEIGEKTLRGALAGSEVGGRKKTTSALPIVSPARRSPHRTCRRLGEDIFYLIFGYNCNVSKLVPRGYFRNF